MGKKTCSNCGMKDSIHRRDEATSNLIFDFGMTDPDGRNTYNIYCRKCQTVNIERASLFGSKPSKTLDMNKLAEAISSGDLDPDALAIVGNKITRVAIEDGVPLPTPSRAA